MKREQQTKEDGTPHAWGRVAETSFHGPAVVSDRDARGSAYVEEQLDDYVESKEQEAGRSRNNRFTYGVLGAGLTFTSGLFTSLSTNPNLVHHYNHYFGVSDNHNSVTYAAVAAGLVGLGLLGTAVVSHLKSRKDLELATDLHGWD
ncbi:MAG: hypothetical protein WC796_00130 [Candidatus Pacearchaeota archaeon]|jgi:hypothetical protein